MSARRTARLVGAPAAQHSRDDRRRGDAHQQHVVEADPDPARLAALPVRALQDTQAAPG